MPVIKYKDVILHFAHIPKCAGSSIEGYVNRIKGAELAFVDSNYVANPAKKPWNNSSPQHVDGASFARLFPKTFFDAFFTIVRDPVSRVKSAYQFQRIVEKKISNDVSLNDFVKKELKENYLNIGWMDNHLLPQTYFLYPKTSYQIFKLEQEGVKAAKRFIDKQLFGNNISLEIPHVNAAKKHNSFDESDLVLSDHSLEIITTAYKYDYERFNYPDPTV